MGYYPVHLEMKNRKCVVVGGGAVAERKVQALLESDAKVTVISPKIGPDLEKLRLERKIVHHQRTYQEGDLANAFLVISATDDSGINKQVRKEAWERKILVNVTDQPELCDFIFPALVKRGDLIISVSTSGTLPALSKKIRKDLERIFGPEYEEYLKILKRTRGKIISRYQNPKVRRKILEKIVHADLLNLVKEGKTKALREKIKECM